MTTGPRLRMLFALALSAATLALDTPNIATIPVPEPRAARAEGGPIAAAFVHADGRGLVCDGKPFSFRAVNFSNFYHTQLTGSELLLSPHHSERDFARVEEMGFNAIRFAFNGEWYVRFPDDFWTWLDRNVQWAREHEIYLIFDLHTPIGGFWLNPLSDKVTFEIWTDPDIRARNVALWREVALRYRDEPFVGAFDILNEPVTTDSNGEQWRRLAQEIAGAIRSVDSNHLLIVGGLYGLNRAYGVGNVDRHFLIDDDNAMYDFHFYEPIKYTHQYATWLKGPVRDGGRYPDSHVIVPTGDQVLLAGSRILSRPLVPGTSDWALYDSGIVPVRDPSASAALPLAVVRGTMRGTVYFDALKVSEYDRKGRLLREIIEPLDSDDALDWYEWRTEPDAPAILTREHSIGYKDSASLSITDAVEDSTAVCGWSNVGHWLKVTPGNQYRISGYMRGDDVALSPGSQAAFELDIYAGSEGAPGGGFLERGKAYLEYEMLKSLQFGIENNVPMSVMEFGLVGKCFEMPGKGGERWVADVLALLAEHEASFAYWEYHGEPMGLYHRGKQGPGRPNEELIEALSRDRMPAILNE